MIPQASLASVPTFMPGLRTMPLPANHSTAGPGQSSSRLQNTPTLPNQPPTTRTISQATAAVAPNDGASAFLSKSTSFQPPLSQNATRLGMKRPSATPRNTVVVDNRGFQQQVSSQARGRTVTPDHHVPGFDSQLPQHSHIDNAPTKNPLPPKITLASSLQSTCNPSTRAEGNRSNSNPSDGMDLDSKTRVQDAVAQTDGRDDVVAQADGWKLGDITLVDQTPPQFSYPASEPSTSSLYQAPSTSSSVLSSSGNRTPPMILRDNIPASYATFHALQSRLLASLTAMTPPDIRTALLHVQSANNHSATALAAAHRAHTLAQQSLASAQESMLAAQGCLKSAEQAHGQVNDALGAVEQINFGGDTEKNSKWEWKELASEFKSDLHALSEWVGEREAQETRIKSAMEKKRATQATGKHLKRAVQTPLVVSNETATFNCAPMDVDSDANNLSHRAPAGVGSNTIGQARKPEREPIAEELNSIPREPESPTLKEHHIPADINVADGQSPILQSADDYDQNRRPEQNSPPLAMDVRASLDDPSQENDSQPEPHQPPTVQAEPRCPAETEKIPSSETVKEVSNESNVATPGNQVSAAQEAREAALRETQAQRRREIAEEKNRANAASAARILANRAKEKSLKAAIPPTLPVRPKADKPIIPVVAQASSTASRLTPEQTKVKAKKKKAQKAPYNNALAPDDASGSDIVPPLPNKLPSGGGSARPGTDHYAPPTSRSDRATRSTLPHDALAGGSLAANIQPPRGPKRAALLPTQVPDIERHTRILREQVRVDSPRHTQKMDASLWVKQEMTSDSAFIWERGRAGSPPTDFDRLHSGTSMSRMNSNPVSSPKVYYPAPNQHEFFDSAESSSLSSSNFDADPNPRLNDEFGYNTSDNTRFYPVIKKEVFSKARPLRESTISDPDMMNKHALNQRHPTQRDWRPSPPRSLTPNPYSAPVPTQPVGQKRYRDFEEDFEQLPLSRRPRLDGPMRPRSPSPPSPRGVRTQSGWSIPGGRPRTPEISPLANRLAPRVPGLPPVGRGDSYRPDYSSSLPRRPYVEPQPFPPAPATRQRQSPPESRTDLIDRFSRPPPAINPRTPISTPRVKARRGARGGGSTLLEQRLSSKSLANRLDGDADVYF